QKTRFLRNYKSSLSLITAFQRFLSSQDNSKEVDHRELFRSFVNETKTLLRRFSLDCGEHLQWRLLIGSVSGEHIQGAVCIGVLTNEDSFCCREETRVMYHGHIARNLLILLLLAYTHFDRHSTELVCIFSNLQSMR
ncbi:hypothetical protein L9F63_004557, partial [Diploptera punctata]